jgi:hypothetical protein
MPVIPSNQWPETRTSSPSRGVQVGIGAGSGLISACRSPSKASQSVNIMQSLNLTGWTPTIPTDMESFRACGQSEYGMKQQPGIIARRPFGSCSVGVQPSSHGTSSRFRNGSVRGGGIRSTTHGRPAGVQGRESGSYLGCSSSSSVPVAVNLTEPDYRQLKRGLPPHKARHNRVLDDRTQQPPLLMLSVAGECSSSS